MQASVEEISTVQQRVKISIASDAVDQAFHEAYKKLQKKANVRGFRPGKAPLNMLKKIYGDGVAADVADQLIKKHLFDAIEEKDLKPVAAPSIEDVNLPKTGEAYNFSAVIDILPELDLKDYKGLKVSCKVMEVDDSAIDHQLSHIQKSHAKRKPLDSSTSLQKGHVATLSLSTTADGAPCPQLTFEKAPIELGSGQLPKEIEDLVIGMKAGETKETTVKLPNEFVVSDLSGKEVQFNIEISEAYELKLPELDDDFAQDLGTESFAKLREDIKSHLERQAKQSRRAQLEGGLVEQIVQANPFEVPPTLVASVIDDMIEQMNIPKEEKQKAKEDEELRKSLLDRAKVKAKNTLILWEVAKLENLEVTEQDIDQHISQHMLGGQQPEDDKQKELFESIRQSFGEKLKQNLIFDKAVDFLIANAEITEENIKN